jgi:RHS repeat-associated protein
VELTLIRRVNVRLKSMLPAFVLGMSVSVLALSGSPANALCWTCSQHQAQGWTDFGSPMGSDPMNCESCYDVAGTSLTASISWGNYRDANGIFYLLATLTPATTQTFRQISDCTENGSVSKCMANSTRIARAAGKLLDSNGYEFGWISNKYDEYGNEVEKKYLIGSSYYGASGTHKIQNAVQADFCHYPNPSNITNSLPDPVWTNSFSVPSGPIAEQNPTPQATVDDTKPTEAIASPTCNLPGQPGCGDPVNTYNGNYYHDEVDLAVKGVLPIIIERKYTSSKESFTGEFGVGSHLATYNYRLSSVPKDANNVVTLSANQEVKLDVGNGDEMTFTNPDGTNKFINNGLLGTAGDYITLTLDATNHYLGAVYHELNGDKHNFDANSRQASIEDRNGNQIVLTRDANGKLTQVKDNATGRYIDITYFANGTIFKVADHTNRTVYYSYSYDKELTNVNRPASKNETFIWDSNHRIVVKKDARNHALARNIYGANGAVTRQITADEGIIDFEYVNSSTRKVKDPRGNETTFHYNSNGVVTQIDDPLGHSVTISYSPNFFTNTTSSRYYEVEDHLGHVTRYDLNERNQPTQITDPANNVTTITYNTTHKDRVASTTDPLNHTISYTYDSNGNLTKITDNAGKESNFTYNSLGQVLTITNPLNKTTTFAYNTNHEVASITDPNSKVTAYGYDSLGRVSSITDPKNNQTTFTYDDQDRLKTATNAQNHVTTYNYDNNGNVTSVTNPRNFQSVYTYDDKNRLTQARNPEYRYTTYAYDTADNLVKVTDPKQQDTVYTYDAANRLTKVTQKDSSGSVAAEYTNTYDVVNRLLSVSDGTDTWSYTYDLLGRLDTVTTPQGSLDYDYNANSLLTQMYSSTYGTVTYGYDSRDRLTSIAKGGNTYGFGYDDAGKRTSLTRPSALNTSYSYDNGSRLTAITHATTGGTVESDALVYDDNGNITKKTKTGGVYGDIVWEYTYDSLNRLTKVWGMGLLPGSSFANQTDENTAKQDIVDAIATSNETTRRTKLEHAVSLGGVVPENATWTFDANSNIATKTVKNLAGGADVTKTMTYSDADHLTSISDGTNTTNLSYDNNGNLTGDGTRTFTWNPLDQLTALNTGSATYDFDYDPLGRRKSLTQGSNTKDYFYDGLNLLSDGTSSFLHGAGLDQPLQVAAGSNTYSYLQDQLGSTSWLVNAANGNLVSRNYYQSYGKLENNGTNPTAANPFTYTGREDDGTGLMYYRARYYDPNLEVFISQDPLGDAQRYVQGNPISFVDPLGLDPDLNLIPLDKKNKNLRQWAQSSIPDSPGAFTVVAHGGPSYIWNTDKEPVYPSQLAKMIMAHPNYKLGQPIILFSCRTGQGSWSFAQILANFSGTPVVAPDNLLWWDSSGPIGVYPRVHVPLLGNFQDTSHPGSFVLFNPNYYMEH